MCESDHPFLNHVSINMNGLGFQFNLYINLHNETNDCRNLHVQKDLQKVLSTPISTVFDILNRKGIFPRCCPEMSLTFPAEKRGGRWIRTTIQVLPRHTASQPLLLPPQHCVREPTHEDISPLYTGCGGTAIANMVIPSVQAVSNQNVSVYLKSHFLMKVTPVTQSISVSQNISVS